MTSKIRIKIGDVEVDYEGPEDFLRDELHALLSAVVELNREQRPYRPAAQASGATNGSGSPTVLSDVGTSNTIAAKLKPTTGPDLVIVSAARLTFGAGLETFSRKEILDEMRKATSYYKQSYASNLSVSLKTLISQDKLREVSHGQYVLSAAERSRLESLLAS